MAKQTEHLVYKKKIFFHVKPTNYNWIEEASRGYKDEWKNYGTL